MTTVAPETDKHASPGGIPAGASAHDPGREPGGNGNGSGGAGAPASRGDGPRRRRRGPLGLVRRLWDALWRGAEERELRARRPMLSDRQAADLERAFGVQRLAAAAIGAAADGRSRPDAALPAIIGLLRESATWALSAAAADPAPTSPAE
ncbi:MAG TPA: hypothetical protein VIU64_00635, partial [Polyangia bacterium]